MEPGNEYVTNSGWLRQVARVDTVDVVADEFERPVTPGAQAFWNPDAGLRWPRTARGWRSWDIQQRGMHARAPSRVGADSSG